VCRKKSGLVVEALFIVLRAFLKGVLEKVGVCVWFFDGKNVVDAWWMW
jgi:hypothetical protein